MQIPNFSRQKDVNVLDHCESLGTKFTMNLLQGFSLRRSFKQPEAKTVGYTKWSMDVAKTINCIGCDESIIEIVVN